jgi:hypothetical protein
MSDTFQFLKSHKLFQADNQSQAEYANKSMLHMCSNSVLKHSKKVAVLL